MAFDPKNTTYFKRARFTTRLPNDYVYAPSHYWLCEVEPGLFHIGMTRFATRMLGDFVEIIVEPATGEAVRSGEPIGTIEGFKAVADLYCAANGEFCGGNDSLLRDPDLVDSDPYDRGWMYAVRGTPGADALDVTGYCDLLTATIDKMLEDQADREKKNC